VSFICASRVSTFTFVEPAGMHSRKCPSSILACRASAVAIQLYTYCASQPIVSSNHSCAGVQIMATYLHSGAANSAVCGLLCQFSSVAAAAAAAAGQVSHAQKLIIKKSQPAKAPAQAAAKGSAAPSNPQPRAAAAASQPRAAGKPQKPAVNSKPVRLMQAIVQPPPQ
jgi:hypothetical protein